jgi:GNAT superfamily N-acetyltransferase
LTGTKDVKSRNLEVRVRTAVPPDADLLWDFLAMAAYERDARAARSVPVVARHLDGWMRPGDFGVIAGGDIGAAWARQFRADENPTVFVNDRTPEITIGVSEKDRARGIGRGLLSALIREARSRSVGLCLTVREGNPAARLYTKAGFRLMPGSEVRNRVGGISFGMIWTPEHR